MKRLEEAYLEDLGLVITRNKKSGLYGIETEDGEIVLLQKYEYLDDTINNRGILVGRDEDGDKVKIDIYSYMPDYMYENKRMKEKSYIVIDEKKEIEVSEEFLDDMNDYIDSVPKLSWSFSGEEYKGNTYIYTDKNSIQTVVNELQKKRVKIPNTLKSFLEKNIVYNNKETTMKRRHFREGPGAGYTYKLSGFYGDFETSVKRLYTYRGQILADIVQTSKKFEFDAKWSGYDWSGEDSDIKGDYIEFESTIEVLNYTDEATELLIEYLQDIGLEEEVDRFFIKNKIDPNELDLDDLLSFFDVNDYIFSDRKYDFNKFIENNTRNMSLDDLQLIAYEEVYGTGYSHVEFSDTIFIDKNDLNKNADFEYTVNDGISLLIKSRRLSDLINESYEDSQYYDDYDDYDD